MGKRSDYKKIGEFCAWDMDSGCRRFVDQSSPCRRKLRKRLKRQERARLKDASRKEADDAFAQRLKKIAKEEYGVEVTVFEGQDGDTFESLFGISLDEAKRMAEMQETEGTL